MVFLKAPRPGLVKTRLGRELGYERAARIYRDLAEGQVRRIPEGFAVEIHYTPRGARAEMRNWLGDDLRYRVQSAGDLGRRLSRAFAHAFHRGAAKVFAIGADCPDLDGPCLSEAARGLEKSEVVVGPAADGGYYLLGLRQPATTLFEGVSWSSPRVLQQTMGRLAATGLTHTILPVMEDIDDVASWQRHDGARATSAT